jgi:hypothetical protein
MGEPAHASFAPAYFNFNFFCCKVGRMRNARTLTKRIAVSILDREGVGAIWKLHVAAAEAHRTGHPRSATAILEIAEAAEAAWLSAKRCVSEPLRQMIQPH